jgi:hypothetical protein
MRQRHIISSSGVTGRHILPAHGTGLGRRRGKRGYCLAPIALVQGIHRLHQAFRSLPVALFQQQRTLRRLGIVDLHQHHAGLVIDVARAIDFIEDKQGGTYQQPGIRAGIGQGNRDAVAVLRILFPEGDALV